MMKRAQDLNGKSRAGTMRRLLASMIVCGAGLTMAVTPGCQKESDEAQAIRQAKLDLEYLAASYVSVADGSASGKVSYSKIVSNLSKAASSSDPGESATAKLLRARANSRMADLLAEKASNAERRVLDSIVVVRGSLNQWKDMNASASALTSYDPAKALAGLDDEIAAKDKEIEKADQATRKLETSLGELRKKQVDAHQRSKTELEHVAKLREQANGKTETQRAELIAQANEAKRKADGFDKEAEDLRSQIENKVARDLAKAQQELAGLTSDRELLITAKKQINSMVEINRAQSERLVAGSKDDKGATFAGANQMRDGLTKQVAVLRGLREKLGDGESGSGMSLMGAYDESQKLYESAASEAGRAKLVTGVKGGPVELDVGTYQQGLADLLMAKARGLQSYTSVMISLAEAKPALPDAGYAKEAADAKELFDKTLLAAQDMYTAAKTSYETAGAKVQATQVKDRLDQLARTLETFDPRLPKQPEVEPTPTPTPAGDGTETATTPAKEGEKPTTPVAIPEGLVGEVLTAMQKLMTDLRKPDLAAFASGVVFKNDRQRDMFNKVIPIQNKAFELDGAVLEHFGRSMTDLALEFSTQLGDKLGMLNMSNMTPDQIAVEYLRHAEASDLVITPVADNPEEATVTSSEGKFKDRITMVKLDGTWKMQLDIPMPPGEITDLFISEFAGAYDAVITKVKGNKYNRDAVAMFNDLFDEVSKAMARILEGKK